MSNHHRRVKGFDIQHVYWLLIVKSNLRLENITSSIFFLWKYCTSESVFSTDDRTLNHFCPHQTRTKYASIRSESVSKWIDAAVSAGANNVNNIYFSLSNQKSEEMKNSLLKDAIDSAKINADIAASAAGVKVIGVKSIIVVEAGSSPPVPVYSAKALDGVAASPTPIISGQQEISASVKIVYLIG